MGHYEQETNIPMSRMGPLRNPSVSEPPPYAYTPLTPEESPEPASPRPGRLTKTAISPPPRPRSESVGSSSHIPPTPIILSNTMRPVNSTDPLVIRDEQFAQIIFEHVIQPRLRKGTLRGKDRESFHYISQTKEDKKQKIYRSRYDEYLGFLASEHKFRFHAVEGALVEKLEEAGYKVKKMKIREIFHHGIEIKWRLREAKGGPRSRASEDSLEGDCCVCRC